MKTDNKIVCLGPSSDNSSIRQELLSQDSRDLLAWVFRKKIPVCDLIAMSINAVEVKIGPEELDYICYGKDGFVAHGGSDAMRYIKHADEESWAIVFAHDCDGDADRGAIVADKYLQQCSISCELEVSEK